VDNYTWNPKTSNWDRREPRRITRRVLWLTVHEQTTKATNAKFVKLAAGQYVAVWEEHTLARNRWQYATTRALLLTAAGKGGRKTISKGRQVELKGLRLHQGDDALALTIDRAPRAAWVTAGAADRQLLLHTLDADLAHKSYPLKLPR